MTIRFVHVCPVCDKSFASAAGLGGHRLWVHGIPGREPRRQAQFVTEHDIIRGFKCFVAEDEGLRDGLSRQQSAWLYEAYKVGITIGARFAAMDEKIEGLALEIGRLSETADQLCAVKIEDLALEIDKLRETSDQRPRKTKVKVKL